jgi:hypothetical protein
MPSRVSPERYEKRLHAFMLGKQEAAKKFADRLGQRPGGAFFELYPDAAL